MIVGRKCSGVSLCVTGGHHAATSFGVLRLVRVVHDRWRLRVFTPVASRAGSRSNHHCRAGGTTGDKPADGEAAPAAAAPVEPAASAPAASAAKAPTVQPSWWTKPAPVIADHETLIAQADSTGAALAKQAAIDAGRAKLEKLGADASRMEILNATVTKVRFDGPFRAFVLVSAPKGTPQIK